MSHYRVTATVQCAPTILSSVPCKAQAPTVETVESDIFQIRLIFHELLPFDEKVTQAKYYRFLSNGCNGNQGNKF